MRLLCVSNYVNAPARLEYRKGQILDVTEVQATFLMSDSPGSFQIMTTAAAPVVDKEIEAPPADKMVRRQSTSTKNRRGK